MNKEELNRLLEKFYNGESTEEEEDLLKIFFREDDIPQGFDAEKAIFNYYSSSMKMPEPSADFGSRILRGIDESESKQRSGRNRTFALWIMSSAAGLLIMIGSYFFFADKEELKDTFSDPEIAYAETLRILFTVSEQLNKGSRALEPVGVINEVKSKEIKKDLKNLEYIQQAIDLTRISGEKK